MALFEHTRTMPAALGSYYRKKRRHKVLGAGALAGGAAYAFRKPLLRAGKSLLPRARRAMNVVTKRARPVWKAIKKAVTIKL